MRPEDILPENVNERLIDGVSVRKGTIAAFMANVRVLADPEATAVDRSSAETHIVEALPSLVALGLFDIFELRNLEIRSFVAKQRELMAEPSRIG